MRPLQSASADISREIDIPAPYGGLNGRDPISNMEPTDALQLDNWYQYENSISVRRGCLEHSDTGQTGSDVISMFDYDAKGIKRLFAAVNGSIYDVTNEYPFVVKQGLNDNDWIEQAFAERVFLVNDSDVDVPLVLDGNTIETAGFTGTGLQPGKLNQVFAYKSRLYFVEKDTLNLWYASLSGVTGTLTKFNLLGAGMGGGVRGSTLVAGASITQDGGAGTDDLMVLFTTKGEAIVYQGDDPGASNWALIGVFEVGEPLHRRAFINAGSDLLYVTRKGVAPLTSVFPFGRTGFEQYLSDKLGDSFRNELRRVTPQAGWQIIFYPRANMVLFNVPYNSTTWHQYVMNTKTRAWFRFTGQNGRCWHVFDNRLFYGAADGKVFEADRGYTDDGTAITATAVPAWTYFGIREVEKAVRQINPVFIGHTQPSIQMSIASDFQAQPALANASFRNENNIAIWDTQIWDQVTWRGDPIYFSANWCGHAIGHAFAVRIEATSNADPLEWISTQFVFEPSRLA